MKSINPADYPTYNVEIKLPSVSGMIWNPNLVWTNMVESKSQKLSQCI